MQRAFVAVWPTPSFGGLSWPVAELIALRLRLAMRVRLARDKLSRALLTYLLLALGGVPLSSHAISNKVFIFIGLSQSPFS